MDLMERLDEVARVLEKMGHAEFACLALDIKCELLKLRKQNANFEKSDRQWEKRVIQLTGLMHDLERLVESTAGAEKRESDSVITGTMLMQNGMENEALKLDREDLIVEFLSIGREDLSDNLMKLVIAYMKRFAEVEERAKVAEESLYNLKNYGCADIPF